MTKYSDSTLMSMTKKDLIEYIRCVEHNADVANERLAQQAENMKDFVPVQHGRWKTTETLLGWRCECSVCGRCSTMEYKYCSYCGARMDEGAAE